jgi:hypothetical protein
MKGTTLIFAALLSLAAVSVFGQCPGGQCPNGQCGGYGGMVPVQQPAYVWQQPPAPTQQTYSQAYVSSLLARIDVLQNQLVQVNASDGLTGIHVFPNGAKVYRINGSWYALDDPSGIKVNTGNGWRYVSPYCAEHGKIVVTQGEIRTIMPRVVVPQGQ